MLARLKLLMVFFKDPNKKNLVIIIKEIIYFTFFKKNTTYRLL